MEPLKIIIPTAGWATRMRPQTWSKPKPLISVAGKTAFDHLLDSFHTLPDTADVEFVIIYSPGLGETQIPPFMKENYPELKVSYVLQPLMKGQSDALWLAREHLGGPVIICFSDTLMETDFSFLTREISEGVAWVKEVSDPRRFGVAEVNADGWVRRLIEKPQSIENTRVVVGCYYFREGGKMLTAIEEQFQRGTSLKGEYFLTDAINIMIEHGMKMRTQNVAVWLDTGTIDATLNTNRYLLEHGRENAANHFGEDVEIIRPVFIHPTAQVSHSTIGPHVSVAADCRITDARVEDSILESGVTVEAATLKGCFIGRQARVTGRSADDTLLTLNIGDNSSIVHK